MAMLLKICAAAALAMVLMCAMSPWIAAVDSSAAEHHSLGWFPTRSPCKGTIADCLAGDDEFEMESEISRRILANTRYISYGALQRNTVPCSRRGASYYNCRSGAQANPYNRGCSAIARCRR